MDQIQEHIKSSPYILMYKELHERMPNWASNGDWSAISWPNLDIMMDNLHKYPCNLISIGKSLQTLIPEAVA